MLPTEQKTAGAGSDALRVYFGHVFPAWSPDGNHVAFLAIAGSAHSEVDRTIHVIDIRKGELERIDISAFGGPLNHVPFGPINWAR